MNRILFSLSLLLVSAFPIQAEPSTFICEYETYSDPKGNHKAESEFILTFIIDRETKKAYMIGNIGSTNVIVIEKSDKVTFLETTDSGNVMTTTIDSKMTSVHSRNTVMFGELVPTQYYGRCQSK